MTFTCQAFDLSVAYRLREVVTASVESQKSPLTEHLFNNLTLISSFIRVLIYDYYTTDSISINKQRIDALRCPPRYNALETVTTPMQMLFSTSILLGVLALHGGQTQATEEKKPCTAHSLKTTSFYDLRPLSLHLPVEGDETLVKGAKTESWRSSGYDYGTNFTMNICAPVLEEVRDVAGLKHEEWKNVSAYYARDGETYSMG